MVFSHAQEDIVVAGNPSEMPKIVLSSQQLSAVVSSGCSWDNLPCHEYPWSTLSALSLYESDLVADFARDFERPAACQWLTCSLGMSWVPVRSSISWQKTVPSRSWWRPSIRMPCSQRRLLAQPRYIWFLDKERERLEMFYGTRYKNSAHCLPTEVNKL